MSQKELPKGLDLAEKLTARFPLRIEHSLKEAVETKCSTEGYPIIPAVQKRNLIYEFVTEDDRNHWKTDQTDPLFSGIDDRTMFPLDARDQFPIQPSLLQQFKIKSSELSIDPARMFRLLCYKWTHM